MTALAAANGPLTDGARVLGIVLAAILAAVAVLAPGARTRAWAMLAVLVLGPSLLVGEIWETPQFQSLRDRPGLAAAAAAGALVVIAGLALVMARRPALLALIAAAALPFRIPIESGGSTANLLVPLYIVIAGGAVAWAVPRLRGGRGETDEWRAAMRGEDGAPPAPEEPRRAPGLLEWLLLGSVVLYALQSAYSSDIPKALEQTIFFYIPFALLFSVLRELDWTPRLARRCLGVIVVLALAFAAIGFVEYQARELLLNPKVIASNQFEDYFRVNSLFFDPNIYGRFLAVAMLGLAAVLLWGERRRTVVVAAVLLAVLWGGLVLTLSQSSFAALLLGLAVLSLLRFRARWTLGAAAAGLVVAAVLLIAFPSAIGVDLGDDKSLDDATSGRSDLIRGGVGLAAEKPVLGQGSAAFEREYRRREGGSRRLATSASHTIPITVAAEQGVIGLAVYLALLAAALARLLRGAKGDPDRAAIAAAFVALVAHTWMYAAFLEDPMAWALLAAGAGLAAAPAAARRGGAGDAAPAAVPAAAAP